MEHSARRGTFSWNNFFIVEHFFFLTEVCRAWPGWGKFPTHYIKGCRVPYIETISIWIVAILVTVVYIVLVGAEASRREGIRIRLRIGAETVLKIAVLNFIVGGFGISRFQVVDDRIQLRRVHRVGRIPQGSEDEGGFGEGEGEANLIHGDKSKKKFVQVKKKVKKKRGAQSAPESTRVARRSQAASTSSLIVLTISNQAWRSARSASVRLA